MTHPDNSRNAYEGYVPAAEGERLAAADIINNTANEFAIHQIGQLQPGHILLDIGAGESPAISRHVRSYEGAVYIAQDVRPEAVASQFRSEDNLSVAIAGDIREGLLLPDESVHTIHARYLLAFFDLQTRGRIVSEMYRALRPGGRMLLTDYDWTGVRGSEDVERLRDLGLSINLFDADFGASSAGEIVSAVDGRVSVSVSRLSFPPLTDYEPLLKLRPVIVNGLLGEEDGERLSAEADALFGRLAGEAEDPNRPSYRWPDAVAVTLEKP